MVYNLTMSNYLNWGQIFGSEIIGSATMIFLIIMLILVVVMIKGMFPAKNMFVVLLVSSLLYAGYLYTPILVVVVVLIIGFIGFSLYKRFIT